MRADLRQHAGPAGALSRQVTLESRAAYLAGWIRALKGDPRLVIIAAANAQKAVDYILNRNPAKLAQPRQTAGLHPAGSGASLPPQRAVSDWNMHHPYAQAWIVRSVSLSRPIAVAIIGATSLPPT